MKNPYCAIENRQWMAIGNIGIAASAIVQPLELMLTIYTSVGLSGGAVSFISPALGRQDLKTAQKYRHKICIHVAQPRIKTK
ncbi:MatE_efflux family protein [Hexamita inflata]|uniref:MatE efflux family protein n=1 Tax=Hexamita inflata TaxID=28002 RepID=A0AA86QCQ4_9EUKA|nr:MatE efflux family protein [Hexamita inflata]